MPLRGILQDRNAVAAQPFGGGTVDSRTHRGEHGQRSVGSGRDVDGGVGVGRVTVELADQIDRQCGDGNPGSSTIARRQAPNSSRVSAPVPHTSSGLPAARPSSSCAPIFASVGAASSLNSTPSSWARSAHNARRPRSRARSRCRASRAGGGAWPRKARWCRRTRRCRRPGLRPVSAQNACHPAASPASAPGARRPSPGPAGVADRQDHHRDVLPGRPAQAGPVTAHRPRRLQQQRDCQGGVRVGEDVLDIVGGVGQQFLTRRHGQPEAETAARPQHGGERRAGMGDQ